MNLTTRGVGLVSCLWLVVWLLRKQQATDAANRAAGIGDVPPYALLALVPGAIGLIIIWSIIYYCAGVYYGSRNHRYRNWFNL